MNPPRILWLVIHADEPANTFQCLAYSEEPTHGAVKHLVTPFIEKKAFDELKEECEFKLLDRSEKYKIAIDKGLMEMAQERDDYRAALEKIKNHDEVGIEDLCAKEVLAKYPKEKS